MLPRKFLFFAAFVFLANCAEPEPLPLLRSVCAPEGLCVATARLANGLEVIIIPDHRTPVVSHMVWYRVGAADEISGKTGLAHFLEHLMFKDSDVKPGFSDRIAHAGGQDNAFTSLDATAYYERIPRDKLALVMQMEARRMAGLALDDAAVETERAVVLEERFGRIDENPSGILSVKANAALFPDHPYGRPIIGFEADIRGLTRADALAFHTKHYAPSNAVLIIAGDVEPAKALALARTHYGRLDARTTKPPATLYTNMQPAKTQITHKDARVQQSVWQRYYPIVNAVEAKKGEGEALSLLAQILGEGPTSRLYRRLVVDKKLASAAGAYASLLRRGPGVFVVYAVPAAGVKPARVAREVEAVLAEMRKTGVNAEELKRAKTQVRAEAIYAQDSQRGLANIFGTARMVGLEVADVLAWSEGVARIKANDIRQAAQTYLLPPAALDAVLLPETQ